MFYIFLVTCVPVRRNTKWWLSVSFFVKCSSSEPSTSSSETPPSFYKTATSTLADQTPARKKKWSRPKEGLILTRTQGSLSKDVGSVPHRICSPWSEWTGTFALNTLTYREYANKGAGAGTARRVRWRGFKVITAASEAQRYTAGQFVGG
ncbi:BnaC01g37060D [Brassica napus]|uniref:Pectinesterase catalytic domain-containing protein n=2 Tax=Brassica TaxID=3705 RepID=A0A3P6F506_BRAOL|nr:unnamed protein product [Brassica napus]CDY33233.1 BnaC01g37060D [Brassica napus]VDD52587.1 unnamed protein product [Brassica oleracea]